MAGKRILVVEDNTLIGLDIAMTLVENGYTVAGPVASETAAFAIVEADPPDAAVLDIHLGRNVDSFGVARALQQRNIPLIFLTGYSAATYDLPKELAHVTRLGKPVHANRLCAAIESVLTCVS